MFRNTFGAALASTAIVIAGPAIAGPGGSSGGGHAATHMTAPTMNAHVDAHATMTAHPTTTIRASTRAPLRASTRATVSSNARSAVRAGATARAHAGVKPSLSTRASASQGLMHASLGAIQRASPRSVLARAAVAPSALPGLDTGLTVKGSGGATIGTVSRVVTGADGKIRLVVATSPTGRTIRLAPNTLSISGGVVTTTTH